MSKILENVVFGMEGEKFVESLPKHEIFIRGLMLTDEQNCNEVRQKTLKWA